ncbi:myosin light chain kinase 3-like isoform X1 [Salvelinus fontinalis]|uniref:myosin light chain kinase 3-like isoform X1 n=2 Tax=Salvelinus fontinalis TaxID=8038 RepID=UPI0024862C57|nr:myosin light chain kinase 3-like isoform X1 [Salvelinus fontinalis]
MSKPETLATCIAKMYEGGKLDNAGAPSGAMKKPTNSLLNSLGGMEVKLNQLEVKVEQIACSQTEVLRRLDMVCQGMRTLEKDLAQLRKDRDSRGGGGDPSLFSEVKVLCGETVALLKNLQQQGKWQREKIEGIESSVSAMDKLWGYVGEVFRSSKIVEFILKGIVPWRKQGLLYIQEEEEKTKSEDSSIKPKVTLCDQGNQVQEEGLQIATSDQPVVELPVKEAKATDHGVEVPNSPEHDPCGLSEALTEGPEVDEALFPSTNSDWGSKGSRKPKEVTLKSREPTRVQTFASDVVVAQVEVTIEVLSELRRTPDVTLISVGSELDSQYINVKETEVPQDPEPTASQPPTSTTEEQPLEQPPEKPPGQPPEKAAESLPLPSKEDTLLGEDFTKAAVSPQEPVIIVTPPTPYSSALTSPLDVVTKPEPEPVTMVPQVQPETVAATEQHKPVPPQPESETMKDSAEPVIPQPTPSLVVKNPTAAVQGAALNAQQLVIDDCPPLPAPFEHRIVSAKQVPMGSYYAVKPNEVLGGGRFGQVYKCAELSSGLILAAKLIKVKGMREREEVKNEIGVMNQLNHVNLIQLYDAFESRTNLTLIMEYVDGGELFDRIVDENYQLTELDAIVFMKQICEGVQYLHQQYILHLDLKPENILCVNSTGNQIKIIDFGLARKYRPREKLKVNFGTPEFLAPEVVNYDFVSFPTDMWSVGVITYMLLSGLSPFLGDNDAETMNNILHANWDFDSEAFENVTEEAKDFVTRLLIPTKCSRLSATGCIKHAWLNNLEDKAKLHQVRLKSQVKLQRYLAAHKQWKKHFYVVAAANRLKRFRQNHPINTVQQ